MTLKDIFSVAAAVLASIGGAGLLIAALSSWLAKMWAARILEGDRARYAAEVENLRGQIQRENMGEKDKLDRTRFVYQRQFDAEFDALSALWNAVAEVRRTMASVRPMFDVRDLDEDPDERMKQRMKPFGRAVDSAISALHDRAPFYPREIQAKAEEVLASARGEQMDVATKRWGAERGPSDHDGFERARENNRELQAHAAELEEMVRNRLESLTVIS